MNALSYPLLAEWRSALKQVIASKEARVLVISGNGRGFCAGLDLTGSREGLNPEDRNEPLRDYFLPVFSLLLLGEKLAAETAADWGLIWKCVADEQLVPEVEAMAKKFATGPTMAYGLMRRLVQKAPENSYKQQLDLEMEYQTFVRASDDAAEARKAFADKRPPLFTGR